MAKRQLSATEAFDLRQALHVAILNALMASRRWGPGDLVFQGGTSLHLAHGSPRFSEDLDFLVGSALKLGPIADSVRAGLDGLPWLPDGAQLQVGKAKDGRNPHAFIVSIGGPDLIGSVKVKVEMWQTAEAALSSVKAFVAPVQLARGPGAGMQAFIPVADLTEIYADKVFALAARPFLKPRDVFDLYWLETQAGLKSCSADQLAVRLETYPHETPSAWLEKAYARWDELQEATQAVHRDLRRWLPPAWPLTEAAAGEMVRSALRALEQGIEMMREIEADYGNGLGYIDEGPRP